MTQLETRYHPFSEYEIRSEGSERLLVGLAAPFGVEARIGNRFTEVIAPGAFKRTLQQRAEKVKVLYRHDDSQLLGAAKRLEERADGLHVELRISKTRLGDEILELISDGALDAFSIGFYPEKDIWTPDRKKVTRCEVKLAEVSVVANPAYEGALIAAVREKQENQFKLLDKWNLKLRAMHL